MTEPRGSNVVPIGVAQGRTQKEQRAFKEELRKKLLNAEEANAMLARYGIKIDKLPLNTLGHASRMFNAADGKIKVQTAEGQPTGSWIVWVSDTGRWTLESATLTVNGYIVAVGDLLRSWAETLQANLDNPKFKINRKLLTDDEKIEMAILIEKLHAEANKLQTPGGLGSVKTMAMVRKPEAYRAHHLSMAQFDLDFDHVIVRNGVVDLRTGELLDHDPSFLLTRYIDVDYFPAAFDNSIHFRPFVERLWDASIYPWMQTSAGYWLTGYTNEQVMWILQGLTGTGKSTYMDAIAGTLGKRRRGGYAAAATSGLLRKKDAHWGDTSTIKGARLIIDSETGQDTVLDAARVKRLTGDKDITANEKYGKHLEFDITGKIVLMTNHAPVFDREGAKDEAVFRRLFIVPMNNQMYAGAYTAGTYLDLPVNLAKPEEKEAILTWMVEGAVRWYQEQPRGLQHNVPQIVQNQMLNFRQRSGGGDLIFDALTDAGYVFRSDLWAKSSDMLAVVNAWLTKMGHGPTSSQRLSDWCVERHLDGPKKRKHDGEQVAWVVGIGQP